MHSFLHRLCLIFVSKSATVIIKCILFSLTNKYYCILRILDTHFCFQAIQNNFFSFVFGILHDLFLKFSSTPYQFIFDVTLTSKINTLIFEKEKTVFGMSI